MSLPTSVLEDLLRRQELHLEHLHCLDEDSQQLMRGSLKKALLPNRRHKPVV